MGCGRSGVGPVIELTAGVASAAEERLPRLDVDVAGIGSGPVPERDHHAGLGALHLLLQAAEKPPVPGQERRSPVDAAVEVGAVLTGQSCKKAGGIDRVKGAREAGPLRSGQEDEILAQSHVVRRLSPATGRNAEPPPGGRRGARGRPRRTHLRQPVRGRQSRPR